MARPSPKRFASVDTFIYDGLGTFITLLWPQPCLTSINYIQKDKDNRDFRAELCSFIHSVHKGL